MATENPIRMPGNNERWSNSRHVYVPNRSESAPPSMEGSFLAVDNLLSRQGSSGYTEPLTTHPNKHNLSRTPSPPIYYPSEYQFVDNQVGRFRSNRGVNIVSSPIHLSQATLSTHKEVSEDESSQQQSVNNSVSDSTNVVDTRQVRLLLPFLEVHKGFDLQDDSSSGLTPQHSRPNSSAGEMNTADENGNFSEMSGGDVVVRDNAASVGIENNSPDESTIISKMKDTNISGSGTAKHPREPRPMYQQLTNVTWIQSGGGNMNYHSVNGTGQFHYGQHVLQSSGLTPPPLYAAAATQTGYVTSPAQVYNMQSHAVYSPQYGYGPYSNMIPHPQFMPGYPSHGPVPFIVRPEFSPQLHGPNAGSVVHRGAESFYAPPGQPSFPDPMYRHYSQQALGHMNAHRRNHKNAPETQKDESRFVRQIRGPNNSNMVTMGLNYYGVQPNMGVMVQYLPSAPPSPGSVPYVEAYPVWQHQGSLEGTNNPRLNNFLEELKSGKGRRFGLSDITGHIVEFSADQHGSRFIQQKLENCNPEEKEAVFRELLPHACKLMTDVFGNYVIQKFFEYGTPSQRKELADQLMGQIIPLRA